MTLRGVTFESNQAELKPDSAEALGKAVKALQENASLRVIIEGHTDDLGEAEYNLELSRQRAETVRQYLIDHGVDGERLQAVGKGETEPLVENTNERARAQNRRVQMVVQ